MKLPSSIRAFVAHRNGKNISVVKFRESKTLGVHLNDKGGKGCKIYEIRHCTRGTVHSHGF